MRTRSITAARASELVQLHLRMHCTRQIVDYHVKKGNLTECVRSLKPIKIDPDKFLDEFASKVRRIHGRNGLDPTLGPPDPPEPPGPESEKKTRRSRIAQEEEAQGMAEWTPPPQPGRVSANFMASGDPNFAPNLLSSTNAAKAWAELEKARKLQIERLASEGEYVRKSDVKPTWEKAFLAVNRSVMGIASKIKSEHPELGFEIVEEIRAECRAALAKSFDDLMELEPAPEDPTTEEKVFQLPDEGDMEFAQ